MNMRINDNGIDRDMTQAEKQAFEHGSSEANNLQSDHDAEFAAIQANKQSGSAKLKALGLTDAEIAALVG